MSRNALRGILASSVFLAGGAISLIAIGTLANILGAPNVPGPYWWCFGVLWAVLGTLGAVAAWRVTKDPL